MRELRKAFFTGLLLCLPLAVTLYVVKLLVELAATPTKGIVKSVLSRYLNLSDLWVEPIAIVISALMVVVLFTIVGIVSRYFLGRILIDSLDSLIGRTPMIKSVYTAIKQIVATFGVKNKANFKQVVLVQFPHAEAWTVAFVTNRDPSEISEKLGYPVVHVFVPTTPNPTGGYFLLLREENVKPLSMTVADGMKLIVSGGAVLPGGVSDKSENESDEN